MIAHLPNWVLNDKNPAFYDSESKTAIEQTAKIYGKMKELIDTMNNFSSGLDEKYEEFTTDTNTSIEEFEVGMRQEFQDFIDLMETTTISAVNYMKNNIGESVNNLISAGSVNVVMQYDEDTEELEMVITENTEDVLDESY